MRQLLPIWIDFIPESEKRYQGVETDMYAYALAAGKLELKHKLEGFWQTTCMKDMEGPTRDYENDIFIHYCQRYEITHYSWSKHDMLGTTLSCKTSLLKYPTPSIDEEKHKHAWVLLHVIRAINAAIREYQQSKCE